MLRRDLEGPLNHVKNKTTQTELNFYSVGREPLKGCKLRNNIGGLHFRKLLLASRKYLDRQLLPGPKRRQKKKLKPDTKWEDKLGSPLNCPLVFPVAEFFLGEESRVSLSCPKNMNWLLEKLLRVKLYLHMYCASLLKVFMFKSWGEMISPVPRVLYGQL